MACHSSRTTTGVSSLRTSTQGHTQGKGALHARGDHQTKQRTTSYLNKTEGTAEPHRLPWDRPATPVGLGRSRNKGGRATCGTLGSRSLRLLCVCLQVLP